MTAPGIVRLEIAQLLPERTLGQPTPLVLPEQRPQRASLTGVLKVCPQLASSVLPDATGAITALRHSAELSKARSIAPSKATASERRHAEVGLAVDRFGASLENDAWLLNSICGVPMIVGSPISRLYRAVDELEWFGAVDPSRPCDIGALWLAGQLDSVRRGFVSPAPVLSLVQGIHTHPDGIEEGFRALLPEEVCEEIGSLCQVVADAVGGETMVAAPAFKGWGLVAESDGDWIQGDTLVELKCVAAGPSARDVMQLLGYALLAELDFLRSRRRKRTFDKLALLLPRQGMVCRGTPDEWLRFCRGPTFTELLVQFARWASDRNDPKEKHFLASPKWTRVEQDASRPAA